MAAVASSISFIGLFGPLLKQPVNRPLRCNSRPVYCAVSESTITPRGPPAKSVKLGSDEFREKLTGEWAGYEVSFDAKTSEALDIPEILVPREFRDYGLRVLGFDVGSSCSVNTDGTALVIKRTRALPTVGCEADAIVTDVKESIYLSDQTFAFDDGSFSVGDNELEEGSRWVFGLARGEERMRIEFRGIDISNATITMFKEKRSGEWCNGEILPGCGGGISSFGEEEKKDYTGELQGEWTMNDFCLTREHDGWKSEFDQYENNRNKAQASEEVSISLPLGVTVGVTKLPENRTTFQVGALYGSSSGSGSRLVLQRDYIDSKLVRVSHRYEVQGSSQDQPQSATLVPEDVEVAIRKEA